MQKVAKFEFVSKERFAIDMEHIGADIEAAYSSLALPVRATMGSAGYDVKTPFAFSLKAGESLRIPTGLRCRISEGWVMLLMPKSGLGFKFRVQLDNTVGVVDQDYYAADNEGHILIQITNDSKEGKTMEIPAGKAFAQALFLPFGITEDDEAEGLRTGGFGSTNS